MRWCWAVLVVSGCFDSSDDPHRPLLPISVVQTFVAAPVAVTAGQVVTLPIPPTTEGDQVAVVLASATSLGEPVSVNLGDNRVRIWLRGLAPDCTSDVETAYEYKVHAASTISFGLDVDATVEVGLIELTPSSGLGPPSRWYDDHEVSRQIGPASAPQLSVDAGAVVLSTIASCEPVQMVSADFVSLGLTTPGADAAFALATQPQVMGARWFYEGSTSHITKTFVFDP
jgi:hypothetical protein